MNESGTFAFTWYDDDGSVYEDSAENYRRLTGPAGPSRRKGGKYGP